MNHPPTPILRPVRVRSFALSDIGRARKNNEDSYICDDEMRMYVVCDGVGAKEGGEVASANAVEETLGFVRRGRNVVRSYAEAPTVEALIAVRRLVESAVQHACYMVYGMGEMEPTRRGMSTTMSALLITKPAAFVAQVGDSRVYRVRGAEAVQLTEDHTLFNYKLKLGLLTPEEIERETDKHVITRAVGHRDYVQVDTCLVDVAPQDVFLLCSDGLHSYLDDGEVAVVLQEGPLEEAAERFVALANYRGGQDNITAVVVVAEG
jgi:PPM family protein phosphatase